MLDSAQNINSIDNSINTERERERLLTHIVNLGCSASFIVIKKQVTEKQRDYLECGGTEKHMATLDGNPGKLSEVINFN